MTADEAIGLYRSTKAERMEKTAEARAEQQARIAASLARAEAELARARRGGRKKGQRAHGPNISIVGRDKRDIGREHQPW